MENISNFNAIYLGGPTMILEISGLRFITDPTFDEANTTYSIGGGLTVTKTAGPVLLESGRSHRLKLPENKRGLLTSDIF